MSLIMDILLQALYLWHLIELTSIMSLTCEIIYQLLCHSYLTLTIAFLNLKVYEVLCH